MELMILLIIGIIVAVWDYRRFEDMMEYYDTIEVPE